jgi:protease-4
MKNLTGRSLRGMATKNLLANALPPAEWGERPKIALVYGLGVCAMDEGIKARWLERVFLKLADKPSIKAVVFRVDSPGGDGMASDLVAEALKKCSEKKPVIISQGQVAGSGGYWLSMYGDTIVAGPNTMTGSIGVIGGWLYDKGLTAILGMTSDHVKRGAHAELGFGVSLPLIGVRIPARNLSTEERKKVEDLFMKFYEGFVQKVAKGRNLPVEEVKKIAEGHFYSGTDGRAIGLVDEIGGLLTALALAQHRAGLKPDQEVKIIEIPQTKGLFDFSLQTSPITTNLENDPVLQYIKMVSERPGRPLPMLLPGTYPTIEER